MYVFTFLPYFFNPKSEKKTIVERVSVHKVSTKGKIKKTKTKKKYKSEVSDTLYKRWITAIFYSRGVRFASVVW